MRFITVTLNPCIDKTYRFNKPIVPGKVNRPVTVTATPGGKGINAAEALFELCRDEYRFRVTPVYFAGGENGKQLCSKIEKRDVMRISEWGYTDTVLPLPEGCETRTCIKLVDPDGMVTEINEPGARLEENSLELLLGALTDMIQPPEKTIVMLCGSIPQGVENNVYNMLISMLKSCGATVVLDCSGEPLKDGIKASPDLIKPNLEELSYIAGRQLDYDTEAVEFSKQLFNRYGCEVLCTNGGKGAFFVGKSGVTYGYINSVSTGTDSRVPGAVGCGDVFLAAFAYEYFKDRSGGEDAAMKLAVSAGKAAAVGFALSGGVCIPTGEKMRAYTDQVEIRKINKDIKEIL